MSYKKEFVKFMWEAGVLTFGEFTLKSGRKAPYFINTGNYKTGEHIAKLGEFYAKCIKENGIHADVFFGPAYKGIPLAVTAAISNYKQNGENVNYCFNRKEAKDHGEGGVMVGHKLQDGDKVLIIEDVTTSGKSIEETVPIIKAQADCDIVGLMVSLNRQEKGQDSDMSALDEIKERYGFGAHAIVTMEDVVSYLYNRPIDGEVLLTKDIKKAIDEYYAEYGAGKN